jgi:predicted amidophosphoribosyltransferase
MKLPPLALIAPSLCPRCDQPAMVLNHSSDDERCAHCGLQLHQCSRCRGVAGPFDRFCGFCGYEMVQGTNRPVWWRLWFLAALLPVALGLIYGIAQSQIGH